ncbi:MAG TPA: UBP-type zinc finger domain-containing protein [Chloroflexia bacterium]|nr:UBP-type zinc finger domain-containing protein [Chloroflexia bacterium]
MQVVQASSNGCEDCLKTGDSWVHLRLCLECGHVGCCDNSKNKHATKHYHTSNHPIIKSFEPGEEWGWCYPDQLYLNPADNQLFQAEVAKLPRRNYRQR